MPVRLYLDQPLAEGQSVALSREHSHYLTGVMRLGVGAELLVFGPETGEFAAQIAEAQKRAVTLSLGAQTRAWSQPPDLWLLFAPIKKARTDFIVEKAVELGVRRICPVQTRFTNSERIRRDRLQAHAMEAAEQCGALFVPEVLELARLEQVLLTWPKERALIFCDEARAGSGAENVLPDAPTAILVGPEGGFSEEERTRLTLISSAVVLPLGPRILRAETAAVAALTLWQSSKGDWRD